MFLEPYCPPFFDEIYCWPGTPAGTTVRRSCSEVMKEDKEIDAAQNIIGETINSFSYNMIST